MQWNHNVSAPFSSIFSGAALQLCSSAQYSESISSSRRSQDPTRPGIQIALWVKYESTDSTGNTGNTGNTGICLKFVFWMGCWSSRSQDYMDQSIISEIKESTKAEGIVKHVKSSNRRQVFYTQWENMGKWWNINCAKRSMASQRGYLWYGNVSSSTKWQMCHPPAHHRCSSDQPTSPRRLAKLWTLEMLPRLQGSKQLCLQQIMLGYAWSFVHVGLLQLKLQALQVLFCTGWKGSNSWALPKPSCATACQCHGKPSCSILVQLSKVPLWDPRSKDEQRFKEQNFHCQVAALQALQLCSVSKKSGSVCLSVLRVLSRNRLSFRKPFGWKFWVGTQ